MKNPSAFPTGQYGIDKDGITIVDDGRGQSLLDYFAGQALVGMLAHGINHEKASFVPEMCYQFAKAMLEEREKHV